MASATLSSKEVSANQPPKPAGGLRRGATDDEILGIGPSSEAVEPDGQLEFNWELEDSDANEKLQKKVAPETDAASELKAALEGNPELRSAVDDAAAYRKSFATPEDARASSTRLADLDRLDALFFSRRPEDHTELAKAVAALDPASFNSLAAAMSELAAARPAANANPQRAETHEVLTPAAAAVKSTSPANPRPADAADSQQSKMDQQTASSDNRSLTPEQTNFFHSANAAAVEDVVHAIEKQVHKLLPEDISQSARNRVVGEIYRELDATLRSNRQLAQQMREAFRSGSLDSDHRRAIVSLVAGRARQALPAVAKRVLNEWTSTIVAANQDRRARQRTAERRVDIAGSGRTGGDSRRPTSPQDINYARMSDSDILNQ